MSKITGLTATQLHSAMHRALCDTATLHHLVPMDVRVLVAISDRGGCTQTDVLEEDLCLRSGSAQVRRSLLALRPQLAIGGTMTGHRTAVELTSAGLSVVQDFARRMRQLTEPWIEETKNGSQRDR